MLKQTSQVFRIPSVVSKPASLLRAKPTRTGYVDKNDPAYDPRIWDDDMDQKLSDAMQDTLDGKMLNYPEVLAQLQSSDEKFGQLTKRDIRMRYSTVLRKHNHKFDFYQKELKAFKQHQGKNGQNGKVTLINGRFVLVPHSKPVEVGNESALLPSQQAVMDVVKSRERLISSMAVLSTLVVEKTTQKAREQKKLHKGLKDSVLDVERLKWTREEDLLLLEAVDNEISYQNMSQYLSIRNRSPEECEERVQQLMRQIK